MPAAVWVGVRSPTASRCPPSPVDPQTSRVVTNVHSDVATGSPRTRPRADTGRMNPDLSTRPPRGVTSVHSRAAGEIRGLVGDVASLLLPMGCAGCGCWDVPICRGCRHLWEGGLRRCEQDTVSLSETEHPPRPGVPVWALAPYQGSARRMVLQ